MGLCRRLIFTFDLMCFEDLLYVLEVHSSHSRDLSMQRGVATDFERLENGDEDSVPQFDEHGHSLSLSPLTSLSLTH
jgi:hypothetical protein